MQMLNKKVGSQTVKLANPPKIIATYSIVGPKEGQGPLREYFDEILNDDTLGKESFEKAESQMMFTAISETLKIAKLKETDIDYLFSGDLLNQIISSSFAAREFSIPFFGLYGACSTMSESLSLASIIMDGGFANYVVATTSSHFSSAERQFRFPLEYGSQRQQSSQWTVTGSGAVILGHEGEFPEITHVTTGKVKDFGQKDANNMGAAMAPAAVDTIVSHFKDTGRTPSYYDIIATGDLGVIGKELANKLIEELGYDIRKQHIDCGEIIFDNEKQNTLSGGSGCGCSAVVFSGYLYKRLMKKEIKKILLVSTGALMSTTSSLQGETIPGIAHAVAIEMK
ncbi:MULTISPECIES: stage V sporulation protein AD [Clostridium]|jgi:stage V sporulation protein AD|uniref:Stage V sporulation protein AD n=1 Tax=Clostridium saccharoperbutylacetonicum N1-4(HMT) TaxID=931276 RepID=M1LPA9_9CLOT|nr:MULTISPECIES: stage V sporulation protein AD [Clostridium]AGF54675.1 stage V sporulation protein AD [Clostridium saccharoperbutylacetonicum N1-4(HMT)]AQR93630.1 stage V sporulation protein AD [Clostridium saccharoperbutylacetonicum]NRT58804.1 stage V sporulation protein AD [Clostridium saccharoperbutylacetonicum]NSB27993.1 stage V sporulation protein AD [Clostridium saccharoperbutylacetonicum]NSB29329.1 stage V sporulation protein AD [Clostridium saccharoperbutylacetonicum]